ncbi:MAG: asparagine synthase [Actinotalea sp.]|nr:asparagine synthase [Actinotalea sp.]
MCGIAGMVRFDGRAPDEHVLRLMGAALEHRGPDGGGTLVREHVGFAHRRLAIIGLSDADQPMVTPDERLAVCFNGEILNYRSLRDTLPWPFRTTGDTEVLLAAHALNGTDAVDGLEGQFAYALHDRCTGDVELFRDPAGILPLYYEVDEHRLVFASELKSLLRALERAPDVDDEALHSYLAQRAVPAPRTLLRGVRKVRAGHRLQVTCEGQVSEHRYSRLPERRVVPRTDGEAVDAVDRALREAVSLNLVADVPVGAYLSGGLDSSLIASYAAELAPDHRLQAFVAGFGVPEFDESEHAAVVAAHVGADLHRVTVDAGRFLERWPDLTWQRDAPLSEPADVAVNELAVQARRSVKVVLSGEGADELFGGYPKHAFAGVGAALDRLPVPLLSRPLAALEHRLPASRARLRVAVRALAAPDERTRLETWFAPFTASERQRLLGTPAPREAAAPAQGSPLERMLAHDVASWLPDNLLERGDRMTMSASLELRPPFLHRGVVDLAASLDARHKVRRGEGKWVLRRLADERLPRSIVARPKSGFRVPLAGWFRDEMRDLADDLLTGPSSWVAERMDAGAVRELLQRHQSGGKSEESRLWTLLSLEMWHRTYRERTRG